MGEEPQQHTDRMVPDGRWQAVIARLAAQSPCRVLGQSFITIEATSRVGIRVDRMSKSPHVMDTIRPGDKRGGRRLEKSLYLFVIVHKQEKDITDPLVISPISFR